MLCWIVLNDEDILIYTSDSADLVYQLLQIAEEGVYISQITWF